MAKKILVIDDEPAVLEFVKKQLSARGYEIITAAAGIEGIHKAIEHKPNLIILDILLPDMEGTVVVDKLKGYPQTKEIPVIFMTCLVKEKEVEGKHLMGGNVYVPKPIKPDDLLAKVAREIGK